MTACVEGVLLCSAPFLRFCLVLWSAVLLGGCTSNSQAISTTVRQALWSQDESSPPLRSDLRYLRVGQGKHFVLLVLGYIDPETDGETEIWYSGAGEVLRFRKGRLVASEGLAVNWAHTRYPAEPPSWTSGSRYLRVRDVMPGYHAGLTDQILVSRIAAPSDSALQGIDPQQLEWFGEQSSGPQPLPPTRFALSSASGATRVVYGEQCLDESYCLHWQRWPPVPAEP